MTSIPKSTFNFLDLLSENNNRDWFAKNKDLYTVEHEKMIAFADELLLGMNKIDNIETLTGKKSLHRIYRDTRFSKDKTPYKNHWGGSFKRATKLRRGGYYFHIEKGSSFVGGGFWSPNPEDLKRIRTEIANDASELRNIITAKTFIKCFGTLDGDGVKTAPKGFDKNHPDIELLRKKQFIISRKFSDRETLAPDFSKEVVNTFENMRPFFNYMSDVLTTNTDGESIY